MRRQRVSLLVLRMCLHTKQLQELPIVGPVSNMSWWLMPRIITWYIPVPLFSRCFLGIFLSRYCTAKLHTFMDITKEKRQKVHNRVGSAVYFCCSVAVLQFQKWLYYSQELTLYFYIYKYIYKYRSIFIVWGNTFRELQHCNSATKVWCQVSGFRFQVSGWRFQGAGFKFQVSVLETWNLKLETWNLKLETWNLKLETRSVKLETWNLKLKAWILKLETEIWKISSKIFVNRNEMFLPLQCQIEEATRWSLKVKIAKVKSGNCAH